MPISPAGIATFGVMLALGFSSLYYYLYRSKGAIRYVGSADSADFLTRTALLTAAALSCAVALFGLGGAVL